MIDVGELVRNAFVDVAEELKDAWVFVDREVYEIIEGTVGVAFLMGLGIRGIDVTKQAKRYEKGRRKTRGR